MNAIRLPIRAPIAKLHSRPPSGDDVIQAAQFAVRQGRARRLPDQPEGTFYPAQGWRMPSQGDGAIRTAYLVDGRVYMNVYEAIIFGPNAPETIRDDWFDCGAMPINK